MRPRTFPSQQAQWCSPGLLAAHSCGGSHGIRLKARTVFPFQPTQLVGHHHVMGDTKAAVSPAEVGPYPWGNLASDKAGALGERVPAGILVPLVFSADGDRLCRLLAEQFGHHGQAHIHAGRDA